MAIFRGVGGSGSSSDNSFLDEVTAQATIATNKASEASASATTASTKADEALASANSAASSLASLQNNSISSASFNTSDGVLTLTKLGGATVTTDLDGRYADLTGATFTGDVSFGDNLKAKFGNSDDLLIYHSTSTGNKSVIEDTGKGGLHLITDSAIYLMTDNGETMLSATKDGGLTLTYNNYIKLQTTVDGIRVWDDAQFDTNINVDGNITVTGTVDGVDIATLNANAIVDGDFTSAGIMTTDGSGGYSVDSSTYATETYVDTAVSNLVDSAPATLDTLNELASALGDDANFSTTVTNSLAGKANLSGADFTGNVTSTGTISANNFSSTLGFSSQYGGLSSQSGTFTTSSGDITTSSGDITTSTGTVSGATISGTTFTCNGNMTVSGTVDGVDISARDAVLTSTTTTANSAMQDLVDDTTPQLGGDLDLNGNDITGTGNISITQASTSTPAITLTNTDTGSTESPTLRLERDGSPADGDQVGQIEFYGRFAGIPPVTAEYASIRGVLNDVTGGTIDGQLDFYATKNQIQTKLMSLTPTTLELTNGTGLDVAGDITVGGTVDGVDIATRDGILSTTTTTANSAMQNLVEDTTPQLGGDLDLNGNDITGSGSITATNGFVSTTGNFITSSGYISTGSGNITAGGNIVVGGTVDGRDVATDGARLDTIPYNKIRHVQLRGTSSQLSLTTSHQNIGNADRIRHPSTPVDCSRYLDLDMSIRWNYVSSAVNDLQLQVQLLVPSGGGTVTNIGTVTKGTFSGYSAPSYYSWYYVSGDYTHLFTEFGRINTTGTNNSSEGVVDAWSYNSLNDRTYFLSYNNPGISFNTGDTLYWSPYAFESAGTLLTITRDIDERYQSNSFQPHHLKFKMAYDDARLEYFVKMKEVSTSDSANISITTATLTDIEEV